SRRRRGVDRRHRRAHRAAFRARSQAPARRPNAGALSSRAPAPHTMRMTTTHPGAPAARADAPSAPLADRPRHARAPPEAAAADRALLDRLDPDTRVRLHRALATLHAPSDLATRRQRRKDARRSRVQSRNERDDALLDNTGIRTLRRKPVFTTPNYFPPEG